MFNHQPTQEPQQQNTSVVDQLFKSRIVWIGTDVNDVMANDIASKILLLSLQDPKADIILFINSPGGSITAGMVISDMADLVPNDLISVGLGMAASMGEFLLAVAGTPGKRFATPSLRVLLHQPSGGAGGDSASVVTQAKLINDMKHVLASRTAKATGQTLEQVIKDGNRDSWYNAEEALAYGFVDHILTDIHDLVNIPAAIERKLAEAAATDTKITKTPIKKSTATKGSK